MKISFFKKKMILDESQYDFYKFEIDIIKLKKEKQKIKSRHFACFVFLQFKSLNFFIKSFFNCIHRIIKAHYAPLCNQPPGA